MRGPQFARIPARARIVGAFVLVSAMGRVGSDAMARPDAVKYKGAVNLRDIGDISPLVAKGRVYRCSQVYSQEVLRELNIKTVIDLRGRAPRGKVHHAPSREAADAAATSSSGVREDNWESPVLLHEQQLDKLGVSPENATLNSQSTGLNAPNDLVSMEPKFNGNGSGNGDGSAPAGEQGSVTRYFNLIPSTQFGYSLLRFPRSVWVEAAGALVTLQDPRKPFIKAFADEQIMGFTKYYILMLEHSRKSIADVLRLFTTRDSYPALIHCAHGKDRTGVIVMLLLLTCHVPPEQITQDYVQSEVELRKYRELMGIAQNAVIPLDEVIIASTEETIRSVLHYITEKYLTVEDYLHTVGLTAQEIEAIRANLTEARRGRS